MVESDAQPGPHQRWMAWLDAEIERAAAGMNLEIGDATACTIHKDGRVTGGLKYHEGRMTAFAEARRLGRSSTDLPGDLQSLGEKWQAEFERRRDTQPTSPPWTSYATGGMEAAQEAIAAFAAGS